MLNGIDVSEYQPANIGALVPYDFLIAQLTNGASYVTPDYAQQLDDALSRGKLAGAYHFVKGGELAAEVDAFCAHFQPYKRRVLAILDWEGSGIAAGPAWRQAWLDQVGAEIGARPVLYGSTSVVGGVTGETLWTAAYGSDPVTNGYAAPAPTPGVMRQYCSRGILPGYGGYLDLDAFWGTAADWARLAGAQPIRKKEREMLYIYNPTRGGGVIGPTGFYPLNPTTPEAVYALQTYGTPDVPNGTLTVAQWDNARQTAINIGDRFAAEVASKVTPTAAPAPAEIDVQALASAAAEAAVVALGKALSNG